MNRIAAVSAAPKNVASNPIVVPKAFDEMFDAQFGRGVREGQQWTEQNPQGAVAKLVRDVQGQVAHPPASTDPSIQGELRQLQSIKNSRTPEGVQKTEWYAANGMKDMWLGYAKEFDSAHSAGTQGARDAMTATELLNRTFDATGDVAMYFKKNFPEARPYVLDPTLVEKQPTSMGPNMSHPSSHSGNSFAAANVLGSLMPERAAEFKQLAKDVAYSRLYAAVHFPHDVAEGAFIGGMVSRSMLDKFADGSLAAEPAKSAARPRRAS